LDEDSAEGSREHQLVLAHAYLHAALGAITVSDEDAKTITTTLRKYFEPISKFVDVSENPFVRAFGGRDDPVV
jgi:hypothetical protein